MTNPIRSLLTASCLLALGCSLSQAQTSSFATKKNPDRYKSQLEQLNYFLADFSYGYYGQMAVEEGWVIMRFQEGKYSKFKVEDMADPVLENRWGQINWDCKNESLCVETDWNEDGKESGILFSESGTTSLAHLMDLLNNFIIAYKGE